jgi:hypothetical protein
MAFVLTNFSSTTLTSSIDAVQTNLPVADGSSFATPGVGDQTPLVIEDAFGNREIVYATDRNGDSFTVTRAEESTTPFAFAAGARVECRITAGTFAALAASGDVDGGTY